MHPRLEGRDLGRVEVRSVARAERAITARRHEELLQVVAQRAQVGRDGPRELERGARRERHVESREHAARDACAADADVRLPRGHLAEEVEGALDADDLDGEAAVGGVALDQRLLDPRGRVACRRGGKDRDDERVLERRMAIVGRIAQQERGRGEHDARETRVSDDELPALLASDRHACERNAPSHPATAGRRGL